jgi:hypothetical protein
MVQNIFRIFSQNVSLALVFYLAISYICPREKSNCINKLEVKLNKW